MEDDPKVNGFIWNKNELNSRGWGVIMIWRTPDLGVFILKGFRNES